MRIFWPTLIFPAALCFVWGASALATAPEALLDAPLPKKGRALSLYRAITPIETHLERMDRLKAAVSRPIIYPVGLEEFVREKDRETDWGRGPALFLNEGISGGLAAKPTLRDYLDNTLQPLGLAWRYDAARDAIVTDFVWHREDSRTSRELLAFMMQNPYPRHRISTKDDPWGDAFNALLSKPENFAKSWPVRFVADQRSSFFIPLQVRSDNMLTAKIKDDSGTEHFLVINDQEGFIKQGPPGSFSYYLFDLNGRFEQGGIWTLGNRRQEDALGVEPDGHRFTLRDSYFQQTCTSTFAFEKGQLVLKDFQIGTEPGNSHLLNNQKGTSLFTTQ